MSKGNYSFLILCCVNPILLPLLSNIEFNAGVLAIIILSFGLQAGIFALFFFHKKAWMKWLCETCSRLDSSDIKKPVYHFEAVFLDFNWFLFSILLPYGTYIKKPLLNIQIFLVFFMAFMLWADLYLSGLHFVLTESVSERWKLCRLPFVSLALMFWALDHSGPYEVNRIVVFLSGVYLLEIVLKLIIQRTRNKMKL